jgi:hypothetical protein
MKKVNIDEREELEGQHSPDPLDRAAAEVEASGREALQAHRLAAAASNVLPAPTGDGTCVEPDCGEEVEPGRRELGLGRCLACAQEHDRKAQRAKRGF